MLVMFGNRNLNEPTDNQTPDSQINLQPFESHLAHFDKPQNTDFHRRLLNANFICAICGNN